MIPEHLVWFVWASGFLLVWLALFVAFAQHRRVMLWASLFTTPFGLTEPLFVPEYWSPPSLFNLANRTGFDIESLIFCFGIGGVGAALYNLLTGARIAPLDPEYRRSPLHRHHYLAIAAPFIAFAILYWLPWNPIWPGIVSMFVGAAATVACRPDLKKKIWTGSILFLVYYALFFLGLHLIAPPGYVERVWNLDALSGLTLGGIPLEELLFAASFGAYWAGVYEHFTWTRPAA